MSAQFHQLLTVNVRLNIYFFFTNRNVTLSHLDIPKCFDHCQNLMIHFEENPHNYIRLINMHMQSVVRIGLLLIEVTLIETSPYVASYVQFRL